MYISAFFTQDYLPKTGLTPTISILRLSDDTVVVTSDAMTESNLAGYYYYNFAAYDENEEYLMVADGGSTLYDSERYKHHGSDYKDIATAVNSKLTYVHGSGDWRTGAGASEESLHDALDSYSNKDGYKYDGESDKEEIITEINENEEKIDEIIEKIDDLSESETTPEGLDRTRY